MENAGRAVCERYYRCPVRCTLCMPGTHPVPSPASTSLTLQPPCWSSAQVARTLTRQSVPWCMHVSGTEMYRWLQCSPLLNAMGCQVLWTPADMRPGLTLQQPVCPAGAPRVHLRRFEAPCATLHQQMLTGSVTRTVHPAAASRRLLMKTKPDCSNFSGYYGSQCTGEWALDRAACRLVMHAIM